VAYARGGALETVVPGVTGVLVADATPRAFADAIVDGVDRPFDSAAIRQHAERFGRQRFVDQMDTVIRETLDAPESAQW
jgi:glycosyltransferase involved in cell wall biosynthesis